MDMILIDDNDILPGVLTEIEAEYSEGYDPSLFGTTDSMVIIGTAFDGPSVEATPVYSVEHAKYLFGSTYDPVSKKEATLVAGIEDAFSRGCRTIYAMRISGEEVKKDYTLLGSRNIRLRVSSITATNVAKDFMMVYDDSPGNETVKIYKPARKATILERKKGLVESSNSVLVNEVKLGRDFSMDKRSSLANVIRSVNSHEGNNVIKLSLVDADGIDITESGEAQSLTLADLSPGLYLLGRDKSLCEIENQIDLSIDEDSNMYKKVNVNTDINSGYPIHASDYNVLKNIFRKIGITTNSRFDFLTVSGICDRAFKKDTNDYEKVDISKFEMYKKLGSGHTITAKAEKRVDADGNEVRPRIIETPLDDENRYAPVKDGIYSMLENMNARYRVLTCGNADDKIADRIPRAEEFQIIMPEEFKIFNDYIKVTPKISDEKVSLSNSYTFKVVKDDMTEEKAITHEAIYPSITLKEIAATNKDPNEVFQGAKIGTMVAYETGGVTTLLVYNGDKFVNVGESAANKFYKTDVVKKAEFADDKVTLIDATKADLTGIEDTHKYLLTDKDEVLYVSKFTDSTTKIEVKNIGQADKILKEDYSIIVSVNESKNAEIDYGKDVVIKYNEDAPVTLEEFIEILNDDDYLGQELKFEIAQASYGEKDDLLHDITKEETTQFHKEVLIKKDRIKTYDYNRYIPYKTEDNFARQLSQHCAYTSLKSASCHGFIGLSRIHDVSLSSVANRVDALVNMSKNFNLYAKNDFGRNLLTRNNTPYQTGRYISIPFVQYPVYVDGYTYISNGAAGYAGMVSALPAEQSSTNQVIDIPNVMFNLSGFQLSRLTNAGYVTTKNTLTKGIVITDGITMCEDQSPMKRLSVNRVIISVEEIIRLAAEPFIGKQKNSANVNALQTAIKSNLDKIVDILITDYTFNVADDSKTAKLNRVDINYRIRPVYEIREVRNKITVTDQL